MVELLFADVFDLGSVGQAEKMRDAEDRLVVAVLVGRMDVASDDVVMHQPVEYEEGPESFLQPLALTFRVFRAICFFVMGRHTPARGGKGRPFLFPGWNCDSIRNPTLLLRIASTI